MLSRLYILPYVICIKGKASRVERERKLISRQTKLCPIHQQNAKVPDQLLKDKETTQYLFGSKDFIGKSCFEEQREKCGWQSSAILLQE